MNWKSRIEDTLGEGNPISYGKGVPIPFSTQFQIAF